MIFTILFIIGLCSGLVGALIGLGGGIILVPATIYVALTLKMIPDLTPQSVVGLSVVMMIFTGLSSTLSYMKSKIVDYKSGLLFFIGSIPGTMLGAWVNQWFDLPSFNIYFGSLMIVLSIILLVRDKLKPINWFVKHGKQIEFTTKKGETYIYGYPIWFAVLLTFVVGFISGLFGVGGGTLLVPAMIVLFLFPPHVAVATSMFLVFLSALVNSASHIYLGNVPWLYTIPVIPGAYLGAKLGAALNKKLKSDTLVLILRVILLLFGIRSIVSGLWG